MAIITDNLRKQAAPTIIAVSSLVIGHTIGKIALPILFSGGNISTLNSRIFKFHVASSVLFLGAFAFSDRKKKSISCNCITLIWSFYVQFSSTI